MIRCFLVGVPGGAKQHIKSQLAQIFIQGSIPSKLVAPIVAQTVSAVPVSELNAIVNANDGIDKHEALCTLARLHGINIPIPEHTDRENKPAAIRPNGKGKGKGKHKVQSFEPKDFRLDPSFFCPQHRWGDWHRFGNLQQCHWCHDRYKLVMTSKLSCDELKTEVPETATIHLTVCKPDFTNDEWNRIIEAPARQILARVRLLENRKLIKAVWGRSFRANGKLASPQIATSVRCFVAIQKDKMETAMQESGFSRVYISPYQLKKVISSLISPTF